MSNPTVFISYAREDVEKAQCLYEQLTEAGIEVWFDKEALFPGQEWKTTIQKAIERCDFFIALLSKSYVSKIGFVQNEIRYALDLLDLRPPERVFIIPARLDESETSYPKLGALHRVDLFEDWNFGVNRIICSIRAYAEDETECKQLKSQLESIAQRISTLEYVVLRRDYDAFGEDVPDERDELDELRQKYISLRKELRLKYGEDYDPLRK